MEEMAVSSSERSMTSRMRRKAKTPPIGCRLQPIPPWLRWLAWLSAGGAVVVLFGLWSLEGGDL
jgi:hypothetical protein